MKSHWGRRVSQVFTVLSLAACFALLAGTAQAQSTQGAILGTVRDSSGSVIPGAEIKITSLEAGTVRTLRSDASGNFRAADAKPGHYRVEARKDGFKASAIDDVELLARQELRQDFTLAVGSVSEVIEVKDQLAAVINTETPSISGSFDSQTVLDLPANFRANGGTSPLSLIQSLPGAQADSSGKVSIQGNLPFQSETSVDGISTQNTTSNNPLSDAWPSAESIRELRIDGVNNNAEFGQPGAVTSVSKSGTNAYHGAAFWYHQNAAFDAIGYGNTSKPKKIGNDFGITAGGPVNIPYLYSGKNRSFFFGTYEGFRLPQQAQVQGVVPTAALKSGDLSYLASPLTNPFTGGTYANNQVPVSATAAKLLSLYPNPNVGSTTLFDGQTNYNANEDNSYNSNQFDIRGDQYFGSKLQVFGRYSWKNISQSQPTLLAIPASQFVDQYRILVLAATYDIKPNLLNEFRFGFTRNNTGTTNGFDGPGFAKSLGIPAIANNLLYFNGITEVDLGSVNSINVDRLSSISKSNTYEYTDTVNWQHGKHNAKFGLDIRHVQAVTPLGFNGADNYGTFDFTSGQFTGNDFADFLIGTPGTTFFDTVRLDNDGRSTHYNFYGQDTWQFSPRLTLTFGLRYEWHPGYQDANGNIGNFDPSVAKSGRVVYPTGKSALLDPGFLASFNACPNLTDPGPTVNGAPCTPVLSASQAGLPESLRTSEKNRILPRIGFAYRPFGNDKTVIRAGYGMYNITTLGSIFYALTGTLQAGTQSYNNQLLPTGPAFAWPDINAGGSGYGAPTYGTAYFGTANDIHFKDPLTQQYNFTVEHELGSGFGLRASYIGSRTQHLVWAPNLNDLPNLSSTVAAIDQPLSARPFPNWGRVNTRASSANSSYNSFQVEVNRRFRKGLSFDSTYTLASNFADNQAHQQSFADENGGSRSTYFYDRHLDYGHVYGTRRNRWITTSLYDLPIGRGKAIGSNWNRLTDAILGGWRMSNIFLIQSGPYLTPFFNGGDPSGTGSGSIYRRSQYPDQVGSAIPSGQSASNWINPAAFVCPGVPNWQPGTVCNIGDGIGTPNPTPIGRFGSARVGSVIGPGTVNLSTGLSKDFAISERVHFKLGGSFTNILNHTNLADPELNISSGNFGKITSARGADYGGRRTGQVNLRLEW